MLRISEESFEHEPAAIVRALAALGYAPLLATHKRLLLGSQVDSASSAADVLSVRGSLPPRAGSVSPLMSA